MKNLIAIVLLSMAFTQIHAQDTSQSDTSLKVKLKEAKGLVVYIDGKKYDPDIIELLDTDKIESVSVLKGEEAEKKYGASEGVIIITSKRITSKIEISNGEPLIIVDGKVSSREAIRELDPDQIESIEVVKGEQAIEKYNAPNGVILIKIKKK